MQTTYKNRRPGPSLLSDNEPRKQKEYKAFDYTLKGIQNLSDINWYDIQAAARSEYGSRGVVFLQTKEGSIAIKAPIDTPLEFFTHLIMKFLKIKSPELRIVRFNDSDYDRIFASIDSSTYHDEALNYILHSRLKAPFLMILEYIPGVSLPNFGQKRANHYLSGRDPSSRTRLINFGILLASDTLINNSDRIPIIWDNRGNTENLLIRCSSEEYTVEQLFDYESCNLNFDFFYGIDNRPCFLDHTDKITAPNVIKYLTRLEAFLNSIFQDLTDIMKAKIDILSDSQIQLNSISIIVKWMKTYSGYELPAIGQLQILLGLIIGYTNITNLNKGILEKLYEDVALFGKIDYLDYWKNSCQTIRIPFIVEVIESIKIACNNFPAEVSFVHHVTLNQYKLDDHSFDEFANNEIPKPKPFDEMKDEELEFIGLDDSDDDIHRNPKRQNSWLRKKLKELFFIDEQSVEGNEFLDSKKNKEQSISMGKSKIENLLESNKVSENTKLGSKEVYKEETKEGNKIA